MFHFIASRRNFIKIPNSFPCFIHNKSFGKEKPLNEKDSLLTLSYLMNKCSLSPDSALSASKKINIKNTENPDFVIDTLKSYDFTNAQITKLLTKYPKLLSFNVENIVKPKLDYLLSLGYLHTELGKFVSTNPGVLTASLEKRFKPNVKLLKSFLETDQQIVKVVNRSSRLLQTDFTSSFLPNVKILESYGVSHANIAKLISLKPRLMMFNSDRFAEIVNSVKEFGFDPCSRLFVIAVKCMSALNPLSWEKKVEAYKSLGMSEKDVISAFIKNPNFMVYSEDKIRKMFDFFVKEMHWDASFMAARPRLFCCSLEKSIIPRCLVMSILSTKGFVRQYPNKDYRFLLMSKTKFLEEYVMKYEDKAPEVLDVFEVEENL